MKFHTFFTNNLPIQLLNDHKKVCEHIGIKVEYFIRDGYEEYNQLYSAHGDFMTKILQESDEEVCCFLDIDCLPHNKKILEDAYSWAKENGSFIGNAQNISHTSMRNHIYAAASCLIINKKAWEKLGSPSLSWFIQDDTQIDTAQILTLRADQIGYPYQLMYPFGFDGEERYTLSGYGEYGTGTIYPATYHYFRLSRFKESLPELWNNRVRDILNNQKLVPRYNSCFYGK